MNQYPDCKKREIALRDLLYRVLRKWRGILLFALLAAVLAALWKGRPAKASGEASAKELEAYQTALDAYETDYLSYQTMIERTKALLTQKRAYLASSILMQLDPAHVGKASASVIVSVDEDARDLVTAGQLVDAYAAFCTEGADWEETAKSLETDPVYIRELVSTNPSVSTTAAYASVGDAASYSGQAERDTLTVSVVHPDKETALALLDELLSQLEAENERLSGVVGGHSITAAERSSGYYADTAIGSRSENLLQELYMLSTNEERLEAQLAKLKKPSAPRAASGFSAKTLIRWAVIGFIGGLCLAVLALMVFLSIKGTVLSAAEMGSVFGIRRLALIPDEKLKSGPLDRLIAKLDLEQKNSGDKASRYLFAARALLTRNPCPAGIVLTGSVKPEKLAKCAEDLKKAIVDSIDAAADTHHIPEILVAAPLRDNPQNLTALHGADGVILVEEIERSPYSSIAEDYLLIRSSGTELLGSILL